MDVLALVVGGRGLVDAHAPDEPVGADKVGTVVEDVVVAGVGLGGAGGVAAPDALLAGPVAAKGRVKDDLLLLEVAGNVAAGEARDGGAKVGRVGGGGGRAADGELGGHVGAAGKEPDGDGVRGKLHGIDAAFVGVEAGAVGVGGGGLERAAGRAAVGTAVDRRRAVGEDGVALGAGLGHGAAGRGVQGDGVGGLAVDALDDVDLAAGGPVGAKGPKGRPDAAADGHVFDVGNEEARVVGVCAADAGGAAASGRVCGAVVDAEVDLVVHVASDASSVGGGTVDIVDKAVGGIRLVKKGKRLGVEEVCVVKGVLDGVGGGLGGSQQGGKSKSRLHCGVDV